MGKCKKRTLRQTNNFSKITYMTREDAVNKVFKSLCQKTKKLDIKNALNTISLFGISAEELSEAGMSYENLNALGSVVN